MGKKAEHEKWGEAKTERFSLRITPTGLKLLQEKASEAGISLSEYLEVWARSENPEALSGE